MKTFSDFLNKKYLLNLCEDFKIESTKFKNKLDDYEKLNLNINNLQSNCLSFHNVIAPEEWDRNFKQYINLNRLKALYLNNRSTPARIYDNMDQFWQDAKLQSCAKSPHTFWDTYEHGRRRQLEQLISNNYGSQSSILVNSGMSAVTVAIESMSLKSNDVFITTEKNYFEIYDYLENFLKLRKISLIKVKVSDLIIAIKIHKPKIVLLETIGNYPETSLINNWQEWLYDFPEIIFIIDNTVQSHLTKWYKEPFNAGKNIIVVESAIKYITEECVAGVIYGWNETLEIVRHYARDTGQFLQEKCFNYLSEGLINNLTTRMKIHSRNTKLFHSILINNASRFLEYCKQLDNNAVDSDIFTEGVGCLVYLKPLNISKLPQSEYNRLILHKWQQLCDNISLKVRAGFGWHETFTRVYDGDSLNQTSSPDYIRVTVGLEPSQRIADLADRLIIALGCVYEDYNGLP